MEKTIFLLALVCFLPFAYAVSSQEAIDFVSKTNNFLSASETAEVSPNVKITSMGKAYWLVSILSSDSLNGFVPVSADKTEIPDSKSVRKDLIKTAYFLRDYEKIKKSAQQQDQWIFTSLNAKRLNDLAARLQSEASLDLTTIASELKDYPDLLLTVDKIKSELNAMHPKATALSSDILDASSFENSFYNNPDTATFSVLQSKLANAFESVSELDSAKTQYLLDSDKLKQGIAKTSLPIQTKQSLGALANAPQELAYLSSIAVSSTNLEESVSNSFDSVFSRAQTFADNLETRILRNASYQVLYGQDNAIIEKTGFSSVSALIDYLLGEENAYYWQNQDELSIMRENWQKATTYFNNSNFETASSFAAKAKTSALRVYEDGFEEQRPIINTDLLITVAVIIIIVLAILLVIRNKGKLLGLVTQQEEDGLEFK